MIYKDAKAEFDEDNLPSCRSDVAQQKPKAPIPKAEVDLSDWRAWRSNRAGECPCGIAQIQCSYHSLEGGRSH